MQIVDLCVSVYSPSGILYYFLLIVLYSFHLYGLILYFLCLYTLEVH